MNPIELLIITLELVDINAYTYTSMILCAYTYTYARSVNGDLVAELKSICNFARRFSKTIHALVYMLLHNNAVNRLVSY